MRHLMSDRRTKRTLVSALLIAGVILAVVAGVAAHDQDAQRHIVGDGIADTPLEADQLQAQQEGRAVEQPLNPNE